MQEDCRKRSKTFPCYKRGENFAYAYNELYAGLPLLLRQACAFAYALTHEPVYVFPEERIHGAFYQYSSNRLQPFYTKPIRSTTDKYPYSSIEGWEELTGRNLPKEEQTVIITDGGFPGHIAWNWDKLLAIGVNGILPDELMTEDVMLFQDL